MKSPGWIELNSLLVLSVTAGEERACRMIGGTESNKNLWSTKGGVSIEKGICQAFNVIPPCFCIKMRILVREDL